MTAKPKKSSKSKRISDQPQANFGGDLKFIDLPGIWQHTTIPAWRLDDELFEEGIGFDGSSIRGWQPINASDMQMTPDPSTAKLDPFHAAPTLSMVCKISDPITGQPYGRDPRYIAQKAENYVKSTGLADTVFFGVGPPPVPRRIKRVRDC